MLVNFTDEELEMFPADNPMSAPIALGHYWNHWSLTFKFRDYFMGDKEWDTQHKMFGELLDERYAGLMSDDEFEKKYNEIFDEETGYPETYGVCDDFSQVVSKWPSLITDDLEHFITFQEIRKEDQPESGGWRWHKWGAYIGEHEPTQEYLYDEEDIDKVLVFHIHTFKKGVRDEH